MGLSVYWEQNSKFDDDNWDEHLALEGLKKTDVARLIKFN